MRPTMTSQPAGYDVVQGRMTSAATPVLVYVSLVGCLGTAALLTSISRVASQPVLPQWLLLAALTAAASAAVVRLLSVRASFSVAETFTFTAVLMCGPDAGTLTVAIECVVISWRLATRGLPGRRLLLNVTAPALAMWIAAHLLFTLFDVDALSRNPLRFGEFALALYLSGGVYYALNTWMIAVAVALEQGLSVRTVWRDHFAQLWVSFIVGAHAAGLITISLRSGPWLLAIVAPIPFLVYYAKRTWAARINDQVRHLQEANEQARALHHQQSLRLQTEIALRERDSQLRAVFDSALDALLVVDDERRLIDANPAACQLLGISHDPLPSSAIDQFLDQTSAKEVALEWADTLARGAGHGDLILAANGNKTVEFSFTASVVPGRHLYIWRDVSRRKLLEAQLQQSQKMETVGRLAGGVAHDFNNLLTVILGYGGVLVDRVEEPFREDAREVVRAAERAAALTRQLLAFSRKQVLQTSVVNLNGLVGGFEKMLRRVVDESIELRTAMDPVLWPVKVDPAQIEQVILNLVVNARDAMPSGGRITVETANVDLPACPFGPGSFDVVPGKYVRLIVRDTGAGMDDVTRAQIFEPFFTTKEEGKGTGLGLAMVYGIVRQSGGHIVVDSAPGAGAAFSIHLPRVESLARLEDAATETHPVAGGSETVLLVEDEPAVRVLACHVLERSGYRVLSAACGEEACQLAGAHLADIDLLLTDIAMPGMDGRKLAARLRGQIPTLSVVLMSGYAGEAVAQQMLEKNTVFLQKPFSAASLARVVRQLLDDRVKRLRHTRASENCP
jgi:PAS domain S-box-containing protein